MAAPEITHTELTEIERWFLARGIPHFIADYNTATRVWTRALPFLLATYLLAAVPIGANTWRDAGIEFAVSIACVVAAWLLLNVFRRQPLLSRPRRIGRVELGVYVLGPAIGHVLLGELADAGLTIAIQLVLLGAAWIVTSYALIPLLSWTLRRSLDSLRVAGAATARALPLLLLVVTFFFMTAEVWQVFARLQGVPYALTLLLFLVAGASFSAHRARRELDDARSATDLSDTAELVKGTPAAGLEIVMGDVADAIGSNELTDRQRVNLLLVIVINQVLLALVVAAAIGAFFLVFGFLGIGAEVIEAWVLHPPHSLWTVHISGRTLMLSEELIRVTGFLATFSGFYFGVQSTTDPKLREGLDEFTEANLQQLFAMRHVYLADRAAGLAAASVSPRELRRSDPSPR